MLGRFPGPACAWGYTPLPCALPCHNSLSGVAHTQTRQIASYDGVVTAMYVHRTMRESPDRASRKCTIGSVYVSYSRSSATPRRRYSAV